MALKEKSFEGFETPALAQKDFLYRVKYLKNAKKYQDNGGTLSVKKEKDNKYYWTLTYNSKKIGSTINRLVKGSKKKKASIVNNMTPKQKANQARFKKVMAEAKKLRSKNKTLTQAQAVKQAWAIMYSKGGKAGSVFSSLKNKAVSAKKNIAYSIIDKTTKSANKKEKATLNKAKKLIQNTYLGATKVKAKKPKRTSEMHTDTKSHNVNIRVVSGIDTKSKKYKDNLQRTKLFISIVSSLGNLKTDGTKRGLKMWLENSIKAKELLLKINADLLTELYKSNLNNAISEYNYWKAV